MVTVEGDAQPGEPLIVPVMRAGKRLPQPTLAESRSRCLRDMARLPAPSVEIAPALRALADVVDRESS